MENCTISRARAATQLAGATCGTGLPPPTAPTPNWRRRPFGNGRGFQYFPTICPTETPRQNWAQLEKPVRRRHYHGRACLRAQLVTRVAAGIPIINSISKLRTRFLSIPRATGIRLQLEAFGVLPKYENMSTEGIEYPSIF